MAEVHLKGRGAQIALIARDGAVRYFAGETVGTLAQFSADELDLVNGDRKAVNERKDDDPPEEEYNGSAAHDMPCDGETEEIDILCIRSEIVLPDQAEPRRESVRTDPQKNSQALLQRRPFTGELLADLIDEGDGPWAA